MTNPQRYVYDDGGRPTSIGRDRGACVARAIAIAARRPYLEVHNGLNAFCALYSHQCKASANSGVPRGIIDLYLATLGWNWIPVGRRLRRHELPTGRIIVAVAGHAIALIDGVVHDTFDSWRGQRPVPGYWREDAP
jgi:hypothetical protein